MFLGSPPIQPSAPSPVYCAECGCTVDPTAWLCANCGSKLHEPGAMKSTNSNAFGTTIGSRPVHSTARAVFRFFLYLGCFVMYIAFTWGQDSSSVDPKSSLVEHGFFIAILLVMVVGDVVVYHSLHSYSLHGSGKDQSLGEEIFGAVLIALFWSLSSGLKMHTLPAAVYAKHLDGGLTVVFCALIFIILWSDGIFDRR